MARIILWSLNDPTGMGESIQPDPISLNTFHINLPAFLKHPMETKEINEAILNTITLYDDLFDDSEEEKLKFFWEYVGEAAYENKASCPLVSHSKEYEWWMQGWLDAQSKERERDNC